MDTPSAQPAARAAGRKGSVSRTRGNLIGGILLICIGALFLAQSLIPGFSFADYWPVLLVVLGVILLLRSRAS